MGRVFQRKQKSGQPRTVTGDFTLADSADCNFKPGRLKKAVSTSHSKKLASTTELAVSPIGINDGVDDDDDDDEEFGDSTKFYKRNRKVIDVKGTLKKFDDADIQYNVYPIDLWFLIGLYIWPESVGKFSSLCRTTHIVSHSAIFWKNLYARFYSEDILLPDDLRLEGMGRLDGLRTRVIKALHLFYEPYVSKQTSFAIRNLNNECLKGKKCVMTWYRQEGKLWHFYFKFTENVAKCVLRQTANLKKNSRSTKFEIDLCNNPDENCCLLDIITKGYIALPNIMGLWLKNCTFTVGSDFQYHCIKMSLNSQNYICSKISENNCIQMKIDPVIDVKLYEWWDQNYL